MFGGDAGDKRDGTIRFVKLMIKLKQRYPDRVFLLVGNRDQNKLRFLSELTQEDLHFPQLPTASWMTGVCRDCRQFIKEAAVAQGRAPSPRSRATHKPPHRRAPHSARPRWCAAQRPRTAPRV